MNALDIIIDNECKLSLEEMGYEFRNDIHVVYNPKGYPELYGEATTELRRSVESRGQLMPHMTFLPLDYTSLFNYVRNENNKLKEEYVRFGKGYLFTKVTDSMLLELQRGFQKIFDKHFINIDVKFEVVLEDNRITLNAYNEETRNIWEKRLL